MAKKMNSTGNPIHPIISRDWQGQIHFTRTTNTHNLIPVESPYRWHERLMGHVIRFLTQTIGVLRW